MYFLQVFCGLVVSWYLISHPFTPSAFLNNYIPNSLKRNIVCYFHMNIHKNKHYFPKHKSISLSKDIYIEIKSET